MIRREANAMGLSAFPYSLCCCSSYGIDLIWNACILILSEAG